jgi:hypothetical protein
MFCAFVDLILEKLAVWNALFAQSGGFIPRRTLFVKYLHI